jgi:hypothetical protein
MAEMIPAELASYGVEWPPTQDELPYDDGMPMETHRHVLQMQLLMDPLRAYLVGRREAFVGGNMFIYFSLEQVRNQDFRGPDFFVALDVPKRDRKSWSSGRRAKDQMSSLSCYRTARQHGTREKRSTSTRTACVSRSISGSIPIRRSGRVLACVMGGTNP